MIDVLFKEDFTEQTTSCHVFSNCDGIIWILTLFSGILQWIWHSRDIKLKKLHSQTLAETLHGKLGGCVDIVEHHTCKKRISVSGGPRQTLSSSHSHLCSSFHPHLPHPSGLSWCVCHLSLNTCTAPHLHHSPKMSLYSNLAGPSHC